MLGGAAGCQRGAHLMVNYDLPWNPNRLEQRFGRIHRIGQTEVCHLWNLCAANTREGEVYRRLLEKLEEPPAVVAEKVATVKAAATKRGRKVSFGIRLHVIVRETASEASAAADKLIEQVDDATVAMAQEVGDDAVDERLRRHVEPHANMSVDEAFPCSRVGDGFA